MYINIIADKIIKEGDVNALHYGVPDRMVDISSAYRFFIEKARQIGGKFPMHDGVTNEYESFTVAVAGDQTFTRTIKDQSIVKVEYRKDADSEWECLDHDKKRCRNCYTHSIYCQRFTGNEKQIFVEDAYVGEYQVTYSGGNVTDFDQADYDAGNISPDYLPDAFHDLLWLRPLLTQTAFYKKERYPIWKAMYEEVYELFKNHYKRDVETEEETIVSDEQEEGNYR